MTSIVLVLRKLSYVIALIYLIFFFRYKLHLFVKDDSDTCKIMLLDTVANIIVGSTAEELWNGSYDEASQCA